MHLTLVTRITVTYYLIHALFIPEVNIAGLLVTKSNYFHTARRVNSALIYSSLLLLFHICVCQQKYQTCHNTRILDTPLYILGVPESRVN